MTQTKDTGWRDILDNSPHLQDISGDGWSDIRNALHKCAKEAKEEYEMNLKALKPMIREHIMKEVREKLHDNILYIGNEVPNAVAMDVRDKFIGLGTPESLLAPNPKER